MSFRDGERIERVQHALEQAGWEALICARPSNVLMLSGYWPVIGTSIVVATREGKLGLIVPEDERGLAEKSAVDELQIFQGGSLDEITTAAQQIRPALERIAKMFRLKGTCGSERDPANEPAPYAGTHSYSGKLPEILAEIIPATFVPADDVLSRLRGVLTSRELERVRISCRIAENAYAIGATQLRPGLTETEAAALFRAPLTTSKILHAQAERAEGFIWCMSGPNSAEAFAAFQRSRACRIELGDLVLIHCNSCADGYWTDITRTYCFGKPDERARRMYEAVFEARHAALDVIRPGVAAAEADRTARDTMSRHGFGDEFKHPTGHGVGFAAINHLARPRLHPASDDVLEPGMVFNIEPGAYIAGYGGMRHCDMVAVTATGSELLTPFQTTLPDCVLQGRYDSARSEIAPHLAK